jgi:L-2-hydroxyglutarate oxidase LhgO
MTVEVVIVGAGVVGLSCAAETSRAGYETLLIERHQSFGQETSSRNSEVIHSGIYYTPGSLKAQLCVRANKNLYAECERMGVWTRRCGKLVVALTQEEEAELEQLRQRGITNGVEGLELLTKVQATKLEANIHCTSALFVPSTGIIDSHELMRAYLHQAESHGVMTAFGVELFEILNTTNGFTLRMKDTTGQFTDVTSKFVINAAGLRCDKIAQMFGVNIDEAGYRLHYNRGHYFRVSSKKSKLVTRLVYPAPRPKFVSLGIHITVDRAGQCKLGPDQEYLDSNVPETEWYHFDEHRKEQFFQSVVKYFPFLERDDLSPDQVGVRPKLQAPGEPPKDFIIAEESKRGLPGLINLIGIESPGLTCAREIAREVTKFLYH